ncbi:MAG: CDP-diacylglycerol--serine O-phosphatidyltransferase [Bacteroidetes bacterium 41-46]|nr:MAG: CDP-diacylglycerol--serine O-phosphatidyltransferase [Bacteroidetes bacterium 41-46]
MRLKSFIPNTITSFNLLFGATAVILAFKGEENAAVYLILAAALMDFLDGFSARLLKAYSAIGKELDSLADLISFGMVPSILIFKRFEALLSSNMTDSNVLFLISLIPLSIILFSALRLAKFNVDSRQTSGFLGLPTPANAILIACYIYYANLNPSFYVIENRLLFWPIVSILLSSLLVSNIPMFSLKLKNLKWKDNRIIYGFLFFGLWIAALAVVFSVNWSGCIVILIVSYILFNIFRYLFTQLTVSRERN